MEYPTERHSRNVDQSDSKYRVLYINENGISISIHIGIEFQCGKLDLFACCAEWSLKSNAELCKEKRDWDWDSWSEGFFERAKEKEKKKKERNRDDVPLNRFQCEYLIFIFWFTESVRQYYQKNQHCNVDVFYSMFAIGSQQLNKIDFKIKWFSLLRLIHIELCVHFDSNVVTSREKIMR